MGNPTSLTERNGDLLAYDYDDLDRLITVTRTKDMGNSTPEWELHYTYDENGNRLSVSDGASELWSLAVPAESAYGTARYGSGHYKRGVLDAMDRPLGISKGATLHAQFRYDLEGRRVGVDFDNGASTNVAFDIVGRPLSLATVNQEQTLLSTAYSYDVASNRIGQVTGSDTFDYKIDDDGKLVGECVNRLVLDGFRDFTNGSLEALKLSDNLSLLPLDDDFLGNELDCDRWRISRQTSYSDMARLKTFIGIEARQDNGLHLRFPRGYTDRTQFRDNVQPLNDPLGYVAAKLDNSIQHRVPLSGDFDLRVDLTDFQGAESLSAGLWIGNQTLEVAVGPYIRFELNAANQLVVKGSGTIYTMTPPQLPTTLRLVRSGSTVTAYAWDSSTSTWMTQAGWIRVFNSDPVWVNLYVHVEGHNNVMTTFKNFLYQAAAPSYATAGTFTSPVYDAGRNVAWDKISWQETLVGGTNVELQVAFADDPSGPWNYIGPDGTSGTRFTTPAGQTVGASKISRYSRVKAYLTGSGAATPSLESIELSFGGSLASQYRQFAFDLAGNLTEAITRTDSSSLEEIRTYDNLNQIIDNEIDDGTTLTTWTYSHDANGNLTSKTDGTDTYDYIFDEDNRLVGVELNSVPVVSYEYDSTSRLIQRVEGGTTTNLHWHDWDLIKEVKTGSISETTNYLVPFGEVLAFERGGDWFYLHGDDLSSTQLVTDENGDQVGRFVHGAWGEELYASESVPGTLENRFIGGLGCRKDSATGLVLMRHRWYDTALMRFISRDPIGLRGGTNLYCYAGNNPVTVSDPEGLAPKRRKKYWEAPRIIVVPLGRFGRNSKCDTFERACATAIATIMPGNRWETHDREETASDNCAYLVKLCRKGKLEPGLYNLFVSRNDCHFRWPLESIPTLDKWQDALKNKGIGDLYDFSQ